MNQNKKVQGWYNHHKKSTRIVVAVVLVFLIAYLAGIIFFNQRFLSGTSINGTDVGCLDVAEANKKLTEHINSSSIQLEFDDGQKETLDAKQLGVSYNEQNSIKKIMDSQNKWLWFTSFFTKDKQTALDIVNVNDDALKNGILSMEHSKVENQKESADAYIQYKDGTFSIVDEVYGTQLNAEQLMNSVKEALSSENKTINVRKVKGYIEPAIKAKDQDTQNRLEACKQYCQSVITYTSSKGETLTLDGSTISQWLTKGEDNKYSLTDESLNTHVAEFVSTVARKYNSVGGTRTFKGSDGSMHTVSGGTYGLRVTQSSETSALIELIKANKSESGRKPIATGATSDENGGLGNTYVEVNISRQHLWYYKNGSCVLESDFVSGTESDSTRRTPSGTYYLYSKERNRVLRGTKKPDGTYEYESPVSYWMPFNRGIGFHDANWRSSFGGSTYINSGSHGCINLPSGFAGRLYSQLSVNTPVVVYR